jgi:hypothetical protein
MCLKIWISKRILVKFCKYRNTKSPKIEDLIAGHRRTDIYVHERMNRQTCIPSLMYCIWYINYPAEIQPEISYIRSKETETELLSIYY